MNLPSCLSQHFTAEQPLVGLAWSQTRGPFSDGTFGLIFCFGITYKMILETWSKEKVRLPIEIFGQIFRKSTLLYKTHKLRNPVIKLVLKQNTLN